MTAVESPCISLVLKMPRDILLDDFKATILKRFSTPVLAEQTAFTYFSQSIPFRIVDDQQSITGIIPEQLSDLLCYLDSTST